MVTLESGLVAIHPPSPYTTAGLDLWLEKGIKSQGIGHNNFYSHIILIDYDTWSDKPRRSADTPSGIRSPALQIIFIIRLYRIDIRSAKSVATYSLMRGLEAASDKDARFSRNSGRRNGAADRSRLYIYLNITVKESDGRAIDIFTYEQNAPRIVAADSAAAAGAPRVERLRITSIIYVLIKIPKI